MNFKVKIHNIGKLKKAEIALRPLTILAGPNNTGKSFISKTLYSIFSSADAPLLAYIQDQLRLLKRSLRRIQRNVKWHSKFQQAKSKILKNPEKNQSETNTLESKLKKALVSISKLENIAIHFNLLESTKDFEQKISQCLQEIEESSNDILLLLKNKKTSEDKLVKERPLPLLDTEDMETLKKDLQKGIEILKQMKTSLNLTWVTVEGFINLLENNLKSTFQVSTLKDIMGDPSKSADIALQHMEIKNKKDNACSIVIAENKIQRNPSLLLLAMLQNSFGPIYLESPLYWKLRNALTTASRRPVLYAGRTSLLIPKYFEDLNFMLMDELSGEPAFPKILNDINQNTIKGKIVIDESGSLKFKEKKGKVHSLPSTSTGIVQLGLLALLIEKKVLDKRTILFIDEPEVNLHPAWQVEMMKVLVALVKAGAFVVMATHSADILKWLEVYLKNHPDEEDLVALNQMALQDDGLAVSVAPEGDTQNQLRSIKKNLTKPYLKLFLEGKE